MLLNKYININLFVLTITEFNNNKHSSEWMFNIHMALLIVFVSPLEWNIFGYVCYMFLNIQSAPFDH